MRYRGVGIRLPFTYEDRTTPHERTPRVVDRRGQVFFVNRAGMLVREHE